MDNRQLLQNAIDYIDAHIKSQITPEDLSRVAGYSYVHLVRLFKLYLGVTRRRRGFSPEWLWRPGARSF